MVFSYQNKGPAGSIGTHVSAVLVEIIRCSIVMLLDLSQAVCASQSQGGPTRENRLEDDTASYPKPSMYGICLH